MVRPTLGSTINVEAKLPGFRLVPERTRHHVQQVGEENLLGIDGDRARFDLRQIENVADQVEQVGAGAVDGAARTRLASRVRLPSGLSVSCWPRIRIELSGVRSSCDMLARNSDLYFDVSASSVAFSSSARRACSISWFLRSTSTLRSASCWAFCSSSSLVCLQLFLLRLQFSGELLRLLEQAFGLHRRLDRIEHDADRLVSCSRNMSARW